MRRGCRQGRESSGTSGRHELDRSADGRRCPRPLMITVTGEALIDLVVDRDGCIGARPGGGPFNTARTMGRLGLAAAFLGRLSQDSFGRLLRASLRQDGRPPL